MDAKHWKAFIRSAVESAEAGKHEQLNLLARALEESERAKQMLRDKGYGWSGLGIYETVRDEVPSILEAQKPEDIKDPRLIEFYNATSSDDGKGGIETQFRWLERQLKSRI
jgi:hypothetical protein